MHNFMLMKNTLISISLLLLNACAYSQQLSQVAFSGGSNLDYFSIVTDQGVQIRIAGDGSVIGWGMEVMSNRYNYYARELQPYMGRVEYYGPDADSISRGKIRSIGSSTFTYYGAYETVEKAGKLRSIGTATFDYYSNYDNKILQGKLKYAGNLQLEYYSSFEDESSRGKLKSVGNISIKYYSIFDDQLNKGKLKSIGTVIYSWYSALEPRTELRGSLKSAQYRQNIAGITYILR
jgi:hypothetical protein